MSYDTTFNIGNFYITPIIFRHTLFEGNPFIPLAFMMHERKIQMCHEKFVKHLKKRIPNLSQANIPVVVDREQGITNAFELETKVPVLHCWNHTKQDFKYWLRDHNVKADERKIYLNDLGIIMHSKNLEEFELTFKELSAKWSQPAIDYFETNLNKKSLEKGSSG